jgi:salicylate hydroxylase
MKISQPILIAGAGIGGLTTALTLQRAGIPVRVLEQADQLFEIGAGVSLAPNATRVLNNLDILKQALAIGHVANRAAIKHYRTGAEMSGYETGAGMEKKWGSPFMQIHRADLHAILVDAVRGNDAQAIHLNARVETVSQDAEQVTVGTAAGTFTGPCLIGADGIRSAVRGQLYAEEKPRFLGYVAWRGVVPLSMLKLPVVPDTAVFLGPSKSLLRYKVRQGTAVNIVAFARSDTWAEENWSLPADPADLRANFADWSPEVLDLIDALATVGPYKWGLFGRSPLPGWQQGRITLVGDAAHPMLPFLGQGAAMAIEDGMLLGRAIASSGTIEHALRRYENVRYARTMETVIRANEQGLKVHSYPVDELTNLPVPQDDFKEFALDASTMEIPQ